MKVIRVAQTSGSSIHEALDDINERMLEQKGVGPEAIISAQYEAISPPIPQSDGKRHGLLLGG